VCEHSYNSVASTSACASMYVYNYVFADSMCKSSSVKICKYIMPTPSLLYSSVYSRKIDTLLSAIPTTQCIRSKLCEICITNMSLTGRFHCCES
jgi:hypothetical protein